ncbi:hypothetical protein [Sphingobium olei]|uniref:Uncharacterized protein n=1 Tax=Sphingobium olei TaxID=420955 RepID=A0ABW3P8D8_9SPHN|nr:hypothetical protein [Sphingobium sp.]
MTGERVGMSEEDGAAGVGAMPPPAPRRNLLPVLILLLLAFALGVALTVWAWPHIQRRWGGEPMTAPPQAVPAPTAYSASAARPLTPEAAQMLDGRVVQLEERLSRITVEAQAASGNAARAEGLLVAFAARRALDSGAPLGYVEGQLRLRFGQAQPRAVAAVINAARDPITLVDLRAGLNQIADEVTKSPGTADWWTALEHEARQLVSIRKESTPSPRPEIAMDRALRYIDAGRVNAALTEVEHMPGRTAADRWIQAARRYMEARRALDLIETAAILEPRQLRGTAGAAVGQTSPLAP